MVGQTAWGQSMVGYVEWTGQRGGQCRHVGKVRDSEAGWR